MKRVRKTGFSCPLHVQQVFGWLGFLFDTTVACAVVLPMLSFYGEVMEIQIAYGTALAFARGTVLIAGILATASDPTDKIVYLHKAAVKEKCVLSRLPFDETKYQAICTLCESNVSMNSKHCGECNRCVDNFDHHCKWLNNCIGACNYRIFVVLIASFEFSSLCCFGSSLYVLITCFAAISTLVKTVLFLHMVMSGVMSISVGYLILFHVWLRTRGLTTYEYIVNNRNEHNSAVRNQTESPSPDWSQHRSRRKAELQRRELGCRNERF